MKNLKFVCLAVLAAVLACGAVSVKASVISYSGSVGLSATNWLNSVSITKFDSSFGTLNSITFELNGHVEGSTAFENEDASPQTVTTDLQAILKLKRPDLSQLVVTIPVASTSDNVSAYDGVQDYAGTSGKTYSALSANSSDTSTSSSIADKALFTGLGSITLPVTANGASTGSGGGNLALLFTTHASASATVTYDYTAVPEPSSFALLCVGIVGLLGYAWRKRAA